MKPVVLLPLCNPIENLMRIKSILSFPRRGNLALAWDLARRDLESRYRRSMIGPLWLLLTPLCLLGIYSLVFGQIFGVNWKMPGDAGEGVGFVLPFFIGLSVYLVLSDVVNSSTVLFSTKRTYVIKSPFPLWVLWVSNLMRAGTHAAVTFVLVVLLAIVQQRLTLPGIAWMLVGLLCCAVFIAALSLLLSSLGPFIGDFSEVNRLLLRVLFYATPITYPLALIPQPYQQWAWLNPLTSMVEVLRMPIVFGQPPALSVLAVFFITSLLLFAVSAWLFKRVKGVISDVV